MLLRFQYQKFLCRVSYVFNNSSVTNILIKYYPQSGLRQVSADQNVYAHLSMYSRVRIGLLYEFG